MTAKQTVAKTNKPRRHFAHINTLTTPSIKHPAPQTRQAQTGVEWRGVARAEHRKREERGAAGNERLQALDSGTARVMPCFLAAKAWFDSIQKSGPKVRKQP